MQTHDTQSWVISDSPGENVHTNDLSTEFGQDHTEPDKDSPKQPSFIGTATFCVEMKKQEETDTENEIYPERFCDEDVFSKEFNRPPSYSSLGNITHFPDLLDLPQSRLSDLTEPKQCESVQRPDEKPSLGTYRPYTSSSRRL